MKRMIKASEQKLESLYSPQASFGGKATVDTAPNGGARLFSYGTCVAETDYIDTEDGLRKIIVFNPGWDASQTTWRHIREFIMQNSEYYVFNQTKRSSLERDMLELDDGRPYILA